MKKSVFTAVLLGCALIILGSCSGLSDGISTDASSSDVARTAVSGTNGTVNVTGMSGTSMTLSYSAGSQKNYARLYVSEGNGTGLVLANQDMSYSGGTEKCVPQGVLSQTSGWASVTYGSADTSSGTTSGTTTASNGITSGGTYKIIAKCSGKSLDDDGWSKANGANVIQWTWGGDQANQKWTITSDGNGYYSIINVYSGLGLDVAEWSTAAGGNIQQWAYSAQNNQKWATEKLSDGYYKVTNKNSGKVMDVSSASADNGANIQQWDWNGSDAQKWTIASVSSSSGTSGSSTTDVTAPSTDGNYTLAWSDEFNGTSLNTSNWVYETGAGGWGNSELEYYTSRSDNVSVSSGALAITAKKESYGGSQWTSARIKTQGLKDFTYGKISARIRMPQGTGLWPAFWMLGSNIGTATWPSCGEIDIMEQVNSAANVVGTDHWDNNGHARWGCPTDSNYWNNFSVDVTQYHVYSVEWTATAINWYVDGKQYMAMDITNSTGSTEEFHKSFFILLNLAVGGNWPGNPDSTTPSSNTMYVDYVRVYQ